MLSAEESRHAVIALRLREGDAVEVFDGCGTTACGVIERAGRRGCAVQVEKLSCAPFDLRFRITLAAAMSKAHRQGFLVEKCTELGVFAIWPMITQRSVTRPGEAAVEKWSRRAVEAAKQSGRAWVPMIAPVSSFADALSRAGGFRVRVFCDVADGTIPIHTAIRDSTSATTPIDIRGSTIDDSIIAFVGPEGGWTDDERQAARAAGLTPVHLSPTILRAETAAVALCAVIAAESAKMSPPVIF